MGGSISREYIDRYDKKRKKSGRGSILIIGLDQSGKTTIMYQLVYNKLCETLPTMGHNKETLLHWGRKWDIFDVGGSVLVRETWRLYARAADGIIFVVDSSDKKRLPEAAAQLKKLYYGEEEAKGTQPTLKAPLLVLANKQDLPNCVPYATIEKKLGLKELNIEKKLILPSNGKTGESLTAGLMWITEACEGKK